MSVIIRPTTGPCSTSTSTGSSYPWQDADVLDAAGLNAAFAAAYDAAAAASASAASAATAAAAASDAASHNVGRNRLHNARFGVNQRTYVSGTALAAGAYAHDRWKAGTGGCTYTFTASPPSTTITITAGTLRQIVEALSVEGGTYTLSWTGTAQGRINAGTYAASPVTVTGLPANTAITIEFNTGTLGNVQLEVGTAATPLEKLGPQMDLANCQRFFQFGYLTAQGYAIAGQPVVWMQPFPVQMRAAPTITLASVSYSNGSGLAPTVYGGFGVSFSVTATTTSSVYVVGNYSASADL